MSRASREYKALDPDTREAVNELTNTIFRQRTGFQGKIDPRTQPDLAAKWLDIRDRIMDNRRAFAQSLTSAATAIAHATQAVATFNVLDTTPPWIKVARREIGVQEVPGAKHNERIMQFIRTCSNITETENQRRYVERVGDDEIKWCSAFVNWCMLQVGIIGTNHALADSWKNWGTPLTEPKCGAIVCYSLQGGKRIDHVAFCDEVDGEFRMLGGNQRGGGGKVSSASFRKHAARHYRWPLNA